MAQGRKLIDCAREMKQFLHRVRIALICVGVYIHTCIKSQHYIITTSLWELAVRTMGSLKPLRSALR